MAKIVYNGCYGGFGLSTEAVKLARELSGDLKWGGVVLFGETYPDGEVCDYDSRGHDVSVKRHDPVLVKVVETLGEGANGEFAKLYIHEVPDGTKYRIVEYDGSEAVETPDIINWETAS